MERQCRAPFHNTRSRLLGCPSNRYTNHFVSQANRVYLIFRPAQQQSSNQRSFSLYALLNSHELCHHHPQFGQAFYAEVQTNAPLNTLLEHFQVTTQEAHVRALAQQPTTRRDPHPTGPPYHPPPP